MMTSGQIAGMMSQQNQYFAGSAQYSQQISQQMPGAYGAGVGGSPGFAQVPGGVPQQGGFSYGGSQGYGTANRVSGGITSAMGGAAQFALAGAGIAAGFGMLGKMGSAALDPFAGGGVGWRMGGRAASAMNLGRVGSGAMRLGMGAVGMLPAAGVLAAGSHVIGSMMAGARESSAVENVLGRNQFMTQASSGATGFSRGQAKGVTDMMRGMEALPEMMTSMSELTRIMDKMGQMGVMQGSSNVAEFKEKFKQNIKLLKDMSKVMASSMEEALPMFGEIKRSGFYTTGDILKNAMNRQITGGATGMSQGQVSQVAQYGAQVSYQQGGTLKSGAQHSLRVAAQLGTAQRMGLLSDDQVREYTGGTGGARGIQMMSQRLTGLAHKMARSSVGMVTGIALGEVKDGSFTGKMDEGLMARHRAGEFSLSELHAMARQKTRTRQAKMSYVSRKNKIRAEMAAGMGVEGTTQVLRHALGDRGFTSPDAQRIMAQRFGMTERDTDLLPMLDKMPEIQAEMKSRGRSEIKRIAQEAFMKENFSWSAVKNKAKKRISSITTEPFKKFGASLRQGLTEMIDDFVDDITGRYKVEVTKGMSTLLRGALSGEKVAQKRMLQMMESSGFLKDRGQGADFTPGRLASAMNWMSGTQTSGERGLETLGAMGVQIYSGSSKSSLRGQGVTALGADYSYTPFVSSSFRGAKREDIRKAADRLTQMGAGRGSDRTSKIMEVLKENRGLATGIHEKTAFMLRNKSNLLREGHKGFMDISGSVGATSLGGFFNQTELSEKFSDAGLGSVASIELIQASTGVMGLEGGKLNKLLMAEGMSLGGLTGMGSVKDSADKIKQLKRELRDSMGDGWDDVEAALGGYGGDTSMDLLFGTPGGKRGGLLTGTSHKINAGVMHDESFEGRGIRKRLFSSKEDAWETKQVNIALSGLRDTGKYRGYVTDALKDRGSGVLRREFAYKVIQKMASDRLSDRHVAMDGKSVRKWESSLSKDERTFYEANKKAIQDVMGTNIISDVLARRAAGKDATPAEAKYLEKRYGLDVNSISPEKAEAFLKLKAMDDAGTLGADGRKKLKELQMNKWNIATTEMMQGISAAGSGIERQVELARGVAGDLGIKLSDDAKSLLTDLEARGELMKGAETKGGAKELIEGGGLQFGEMAGRLGKLSSRERALVLRGQGELGAAYAKRKRTSQLLRRAGGGGGRSVKLSRMFDDEAIMGMDDSARAEILSIAGEDKRFDPKEQERLKNYMADKATSGTLAASGIISKNAQANPADIAASMTTFVESTKQLASFIQANFPKDKK